MNVFNEYMMVIVLWAEKQWPGSMHALRNVIVDIPPNAKFGDMTTNAALILSKHLQQPIYEIADAIGKHLMITQAVKSYEVTKHGFVNWRFKKDWLAGMGNQIYTVGKNWGRTSIGPKKNVLVEYVSANPTGPLHVGHVRGAILGDIVCNLLEYQGWQVTREYYINDYGNQIDKLVDSAYARYRQALGLMYYVPVDGYHGEYLLDFAREVAADFDDSLIEYDEALFEKTCRARLIDWMMDWIRKDLEAIGIIHDTFTSEKGIAEAGLIEAALGCLSLKNMVYLGESSTGNPNRVPLIFKSTDDGDDKDRVLQRENGAYTYFAGDLGYIQQKNERSFDRIIQFMGQDHQGYEKRLVSAAKELTNGQMNLEIAFFEMVNLLEEGAAVTMSKRSGKLVTLRDLLTKVDKDSIRFWMAWRKSNEVIDFDVKKVVEQNASNPLWYIQYAHARINSTTNKAVDLFHDLNDEDLIIQEELLDETSSKILMTVMRWPSIVQKATDNLEPHRLALELYNLSKEFHQWYQASAKNGKMFVQADRKITGHNIALVTLVRYAIVNGLELLGITPKDKM